MTGILLIIVGAIYLLVALQYYLSNETGLCIAFIAYAVANLGIYMAGK